MVRPNVLRTVVLALLGIVVLAGLTAWWLHTHERVERSIPMPRTGEARRNPLYALQVALQKDGIEVNARRRLQLLSGGSKEATVPLQARDTVVIYNDPRTLTRDEIDALLRWVSHGGHLVVRTPPMGLLATNSPVPLFAELQLMPMGRDASECEEVKGIRAQPADPAAALVGLEDDDHAGQDFLFCGDRRFTLVGANPAHSWGDLK